jgi:transposase-like protein
MTTLSENGTAKTTMMRLVEREDPQGRDIRQIVLDTYREAGALAPTGKRLGVSTATVAVWLRQFGYRIGRHATPTEE